jgi:hypothetical protein
LILDDILKLIKDHGLLVRPSLTGNWRAGLWKGVDGQINGRCYCVENTEVEKETLEEAVITCVKQLSKMKF